MARFDGSLARQFDFGPPVTAPAAGGSRLRLASEVGGRRVRDKYQVLEHRRRQAQIKARHLLDAIDREPVEAVTDGGVNG